MAFEQNIPLYNSIHLRYYTLVCIIYTIIVYQSSYCLHLQNCGLC